MTTPAEIAARIVAQRRATLPSLRPIAAGARERAHEMYNKRQGIQEEIKQANQERELIAGHPLDLFPTPPDLAARMVAICAKNAKPDSTWLEPSAGTGRIADAISRAGFIPVCVELNYSCAELLERKDYPVTHGDFMEFNGVSDRIAMNPPFSNGQDIKHIRHAYDLLRPGGCLVAIACAGSLSRSDRQAREFQQWLTNYHARVEELPAGTFKTSGTMVNAVLITMYAQA